MTYTVIFNDPGDPRGLLKVHYEDDRVTDVFDALKLATADVVDQAGDATVRRMEVSVHYTDEYGVLNVTPFSGRSPGAKIALDRINDLPEYLRNGGESDYGSL